MKSTEPAGGPRPSSTDSDSPLGSRKDFPISEHIAYLDNAFIAPLPKPVRAAAERWYHHRNAEETDIYAIFEKVEKVRHQFAAMINAAPEEVGFLYTTSEGENIVCRALQLGPGDNLVTDDLSYPHVGVLGKRLEAEQGVDFRIVEHHEGGVGVEDFERCVDRRTRLVCVPWVSNISAFRHDVRALADLAHAHDALLYVDAIQLVGTEPIDVKREGMDFLCSGTYKWLMSGFGIAPLYVRREVLDRISPDRYGWQTALRSPSSGYRYEHLTTAGKFEYGSLAFDQFYPLSTALAYLDGLGLDRIAAYSRTLIGHLREQLESLGFRIFTPAGNVAPSLTFWVGADEKVVEATCRDAGIRVGFASGSRMSETYSRNAERCRVRISPAHYNLVSELDRLLDVMDGFPR